MKLGDHKLQTGVEPLPHPYVNEINDIDNEVTESDVLPTSVKAQMYKGVDATPFLFVETEEQLKELKEHLCEESIKEVAVDLEHHSFRSYQGFTCLMQVSTRFRDFIIDTIKLRPLIGPYLSSMFANPQIRKVLHGSDYDIEWLQKDFGIFVVNLFDTG